MTIRRSNSLAWRLIHTCDVLVQGITNDLHRYPLLGRDFPQLYERGFKACQPSILLPRSVDNSAFGITILCGWLEQLNESKQCVLVCGKRDMCFHRVPVYPIMLASVPFTTLWSMPRTQNSIRI